MDRVAANTYLVNKYASLAAFTGQATTDTANGYGPAIDDALLMLGIGYSSLVGYTIPDGSVKAYRVLLRVYALRQFADQLAGFETFDITGDGMNTKRNAQLVQVLQLLAEAEAEAAALGFVIDIQGSGVVMSSGRFSLDFLEPAP